MKKYLTLTLTIMCTYLIWIGCSNTVSSDEDVNTSWVFVANEGKFGASNGSISMINDYGELIGLDLKEYDTSMTILKTIAKKNECIIMEISNKVVEDTNRKVYEILIRQNIESKYIKYQ